MQLKLVYLAVLVVFLGCMYSAIIISDALDAGVENLWPIMFAVSSVCALCVFVSCLILKLSEKEDVELKSMQNSSSNSAET